MATADALSIITAAAGHYLMGQQSLINSTATGGSTTSVIDSSLITFSRDQSYVGGYVYFWSGSQAGQQRYVSSVDLSTGTLSWTNTLSGAIASGDKYIWLRDGPWDKWLGWLNDAAQNLYFDQNVYVRGVTDQLWYTLPTPFSHGQWVEQVYRGKYPFRFSDQFPRIVDWYRLDPLDIQQNIALVLEKSIGANEQLLFAGRIPYAQDSMQAFTMIASILTPFGQTEGISMPRDVAVLAVIWRALTEKLANSTGVPRQVWEANLKRCAGMYAEKLSLSGVKIAGRKVGFLERP